MLGGCVSPPVPPTMPLATTTLLALLALVIEAALGYPDWLYRAIGHPVGWMGALLGRLDAVLNRPGMSFAVRRGAGPAALILLLGATAAVTVPLQIRFGQSALGLVVLAILAASLPAQRGLHAHVRAVADALDRKGLAGARQAVSMIVGRNPAALDEAGVARAAIESLAENFSDGVVAPAVWLALGGLPGGALYKAANTADSMIGHKSERHLAFGWAAARFDDLVNLPASRLAALWIILAAPLCGSSASAAWHAVRRDASRHRSPNAGWPEAAMAGALGLKLNGPRVYGDTMVQDAHMGDGRRNATAADIRKALTLYRTACALQLVVLAGLAVALGS